jgi:hypothetical protein
MPNSLALILADSSRQTISTSKPKWELQKLSQKHKTIVALHAQGVSRHDIGKVADCTPEYVSMIVAQPLAQKYLAELEQYLDSRVKSLYSRTVDVIAGGLDSDDEEVQLKAARLQLEVTGKLKGDKKESQSAEDVVAAILQKATVIIGNNVQVNQSGD